VKKVPIHVVSVLLATFLAACGTGSPPTAKPTLPPPVTPPEAAPVETRHQFVTNTITVPMSQAQSLELALNLDDDSQGQTDNLLGRLFATFLDISPEFELQSTANEMIASGQAVMLHAVVANDLANDAEVHWSVLQGQASSPPRFDGSDIFTVDTSFAARSSMLPGSISNGHFSGGPGSARLQLVFLDVPIALDLIGVRLETDVYATGCTNGRIGGGIRQEDFLNSFLPAIAQGLNQTIAAEPASSFSQTVLTVFDGDGNGTIANDELQSNFLLNLATTPDLDLLDASGNFNPGQDGVRDSLSIGLGFTCVPASFNAP
jgi:hypothetical protein